MLRFILSLLYNAVPDNEVSHKEIFVTFLSMVGVVLIIALILVITS